MSGVNKETLAQMVETIVDEIHPQKVILFGSQARGNPDNDSDVDFLIVDSNPFGPERSRRKEMARIWKALGKYMLPVDLLLYSQTEFDQRKRSRSHVAALADREGKVMYER